MTYVPFLSVTPASLRPGDLVLWWMSDLALCIAVSPHDPFTDYVLLGPTRGVIHIINGLDYVRVVRRVDSSR